MNFFKHFEYRVHKTLVNNTYTVKQRTYDSHETPGCSTFVAQYSYIRYFWSTCRDLYHPSTRKPFSQTEQKLAPITTRDLYSYNKQHDKAN